MSNYKRLPEGFETRAAGPAITGVLMRFSKTILFTVFGLYFICKS